MLVKEHVNQWWITVPQSVICTLIPLTSQIPTTICPLKRPLIQIPSTDTDNLISREGMHLWIINAKCTKEMTTVITWAQNRKTIERAAVPCPIFIKIFHCQEVTDFMWWTIMPIYVPHTPGSHTGNRKRHAVGDLEKWTEDAIPTKEGKQRTGRVTGANMSSQWILFNSSIGQIRDKQTQKPHVHWLYLLNYFLWFFCLFVILHISFLKAKKP